MNRLLLRLLVLVLPSLAMIASTAFAFERDHNKGKAMRARADISGPNGISGTALLVEDGRGNVVVTIFVKGPPSALTPGKHGVHIHEVGKCEAPTFASAGGHFDPGPAGNPDPVKNHPFHMGDLENLVVNRRGEGTLIDVTTRVTLSPSDTSVFDANGSAIIIHALEDQRTCHPGQPGVLPAGVECTGVSGGGRIACGVIEPAD
jgi:superoxide dismutase, Cu-Zn family